MATFAFEWNEEKALTNITKHGVSFEEASTVLSDDHSITIYDEAHSSDEDRYIDIGLSISNRLLVVVYTERMDHIRIISARQATGAERRLYEQ
ncbi:MAG: BrnT family toxin [Kiritimatiellales bacterium]